MQQPVTRWTFLLFAVMLIGLSGCVMLEPMAEAGTVSEDASGMEAAVRVMTQDVRTHASRGDVEIVSEASAQMCIQMMAF